MCFEITENSLVSPNVFLLRSGVPEEVVPADSRAEETGRETQKHDSE